MKKMKKNSISTTLVITVLAVSLIFGGLHLISSNTSTADVDNRTFVNVFDSSNGNKLPVYSGTKPGSAKSDAFSSMPAIDGTSTNLFGGHNAAAAGTSNDNTLSGSNTIFISGNSSYINSGSGGYGSLGMYAGSMRQSSGSGERGSASLVMLSRSSLSSGNLLDNGELLNGKDGFGVQLSGEIGVWPDPVPVGGAFCFLFILAFIYVVRMRLIK